MIDYMLWGINYLPELDTFINRTKLPIHIVINMSNKRFVYIEKAFVSMWDLLY